MKRKILLSLMIIIGLILFCSCGHRGETYYKFLKVMVSPVTYSEGVENSLNNFKDYITDDSAMDSITSDKTLNVYNDFINKYELTSIKDFRIREVYIKDNDDESEVTCIAEYRFTSKDFDIHMNDYYKFTLDKDSSLIKKASIDKNKSSIYNIVLKN